MAKDLRSTFVSMLISVLDVDPRTAQDIVGHSSIDVTSGIYARSKEAPRRKAQESYEAFIKRRCTGALEIVADEDGER